jgi:predicted short-subunit dehydrogenase-like oxidoreductase (DUF2520 family)
MLPAVKRPDLRQPGLRQVKIAIVGAGRVGVALAVRLTEAGYTVQQVFSRDAPRSRSTARRLAQRVGATPSIAGGSRLSAGLVWFCVPDGVIASAAAEFAHDNWKGKYAFHASGALSCDQLRLLRLKGAQVASVHPLMTFVPGQMPVFTSVPFAIEGDPGAVNLAARIAADLGGSVFRIRKSHKTAYHAFAVMICPLLVSLLATGERVGALAGISRRRMRHAMLPIIRQTLANYEKLGAAKSFTGPIARGDAKTVQRHLQSLAPERPARQVYIALAQAALEYLRVRSPKALMQLLHQLISAKSAKTRRSLQ